MKTLTYHGPGGQRLDAFILEALPHLPQSALHKWLRQNKLKLNGKKRPLSTLLAAGDEARLYLPDAALAPPALRVLYEDAGLLAADKPAGLASEGEGDSLLARARTYLGAGPGGALPALCHRLDTGTSGLLLLAKTAPVLGFVAGLLRQHLLQKTYYGLTLGRPAPPAGVLRGYLLKDATSGTVRVLPRPAPGAKSAETRYETLAENGELALLRLWPRTGRTHQLRAQLAAIGTPLVGDSRYGELAANRRLRCRYQCLCAARLQFPADAPPEFAAYAGLDISCPPPWFYTRMMEGKM